MNNFKHFFGIYLRGIAMGAADVVPGVSGGTIAFISGIYEELLDTIKGFNLSALKTLKNEGIVATWKKLNLGFIVSLALGILTSIVSLAGLISGILEEKGETFNKIALWSFFFGLIIASILYIGKQVKAWNVKNIVGLVAGAALAYYITIAPISSDSSSLLFLFFAGSIAISAMILPGISGSFILVLLGAYQPIMGAIKSVTEIKDMAALWGPIGIISVVGSGCVIGLLTFSRVLSWLFKKHETITLATLTGFMLGSLNKIWPWKKAISTRINSHGEEVPVQFSNMMPSDYSPPSGIDSSWGYALMFAAIGFAVVFLLEFFGNKLKKEND
ncbi:MAG: putative membrane protein [Glaciecola sp.]|jgi:putative membrane protein